MSRGHARLWWNTQKTHVLFADIAIPVRGDLESWCDDFMSRFGALFGLPRAADHLSFAEMDEIGSSLVRLRAWQTYDDIDLHGAMVDVVIDLRMHEAITVGSTLRPVERVAAGGAVRDTRQFENRASTAFAHAGSVFADAESGPFEIDSAYWATGDTAREAVLLKAPLSSEWPNLFAEAVIDTATASVLDVRRCKRADALGAGNANGTGDSEEDGSTYDLESITIDDEFAALESLDTIAPNDATSLLRLAEDQGLVWVHAYVDVTSAPTIDDVRALAADGARLLERVSLSTWRAALKAAPESLLRVASRNQILRVVPVQPDEKYRSEALAAPAREVAEYVVYVYPDVELARTRSELKGVLAARRAVEWSRLHAVVMSMATHSIARVAALDGVKWVERHTSNWQVVGISRCDQRDAPQPCTSDILTRVGLPPIRYYLGLRSALPTPPFDARPIRAFILDTGSISGKSPELPPITNLNTALGGDGGHAGQVASVLARENKSVDRDFEMGVAPSPELDRLYTIPARTAVASGDLDGFERVLTMMGTRIHADGGLDTARFVANMSLQQTDSLFGVYRAADMVLDDWIVETGVPVVVAAGNESCMRVPKKSEMVLTPAVAKNAITVGGIDCGGRTYVKSQEGTLGSWRKPEVSALAKDVPTPIAANGTSFAAPAIAGLIALMLRRTGTEIARPSTMKAILVHTARGFNLSPSYGVPNADECVRIAASTPREWHEVKELRPSEIGKWLGVGVNMDSGLRQEESRILKTTGSRLTIAWDDPSQAVGSRSTIAHAVELRAVFVKQKKVRVRVFRFNGSNLQTIGVIERGMTARLTFAYRCASGSEVSHEQCISVVGCTSAEARPPRITHVVTPDRVYTGNDEPVVVQPGTSLTVRIEGSGLHRGRLGRSPRSVKLKNRRDSSADGIDVIEFTMVIARGGRSRFRVYIETVGGVVDRQFRIDAAGSLPRFDGGKSVTPRPIRLGSEELVRIPGTGLVSQATGVEAEATVKRIVPGRRTRSVVAQIVDVTDELLTIAPAFERKGTYRIRYASVTRAWSTSVRVKVKK